jgi:N-acetylneuraminic acid mutarotase
MNKLVFLLLLFFFISGTFAISFTPVSALELVENSWSTRTPMTQPRTSGTVALNGKIYAIGGSTPEATIPVLNSIYLRPIVGTNECYDPKTDKWTTLKPMPTPRENFAMTTCEGKIYCIGGIAFTPDQTKLCYSEGNEVYDPITDSWSSKASFPISDLPPHTYAVDGQIFAITQGCVLYVYNPITDSWSNKASLPSNYGSYPQIYVVDGHFFAITRGKMCEYDSTTDSWINKAIPFSGSGAFSVVVDNKIIFGDYISKELYGVYTFSVQLKVLIYDPKTDAWSEGKTSPEPALYIDISGVAGATIGMYAPKNVYVFGASYDEIYASGQPFTWVYNPVNDDWSTAKIMSQFTSDESRFVYNVLNVDDVLYVIGATVNKQYVPIGYNPRGYPTLAPITVPSITDVTSSPVPSESSGSSSNGSYFVAVVLTIGIVVTTSLFFYLRKEKKNKRHSV